ncbi:MAG: 5-bromo-4-chloroindolyl phosphate hydrolysis family protein [Gallicola sp.]|nr:5-bromo-4-chloroindolyl phosphate hydrolysis family protein [Gallicola sp.]
MNKSELIQLFYGLLGGIGGLILAILLQMPIPLMIVIPIGAYFGVYMVSKPQVKIGNIALSKANSEDLKKMMEEGYSDLQILKKGSDGIQNEKIRQLSDQLYHRGVDIYEHLQANPDKIPIAKRFLNYYLDTASGLVEKYDRLSTSKVQGASVDHAEREVQEGLTVLTKAFDKEFEHMMQGEIMDIELDVKVLEQTFKTEE